MKKFLIAMAGLSLLAFSQPAFARSETFTIKGAWDSSGSSKVKEFDQETIKNVKFIMKLPEVYQKLGNCNYFVGGADFEFYHECKITIEAKLITNPAEKMYNGKEKEYLITKVLKVEMAGK